MAGMGNTFSKTAGVVALAAAAVVAVPALEMVLFRRYGASPVPGPYDLNGTVGCSSAGGGAGVAVGVGWVWLGDSLSAGVGADRLEDSFPWQTATEVARRAGRDIELICLALPGATAIDVLNGQVPSAVRVLGQGMTAVVAVGCNDVLRMVRPSAFRAAYAAILRTLTATGAKVVAVGVPDLGSMMAVMAQPLRAIVGLAGRCLDHTIRIVADETGASYVAINASLSGREYRLTRPALAADAWHPSGAGYGIWAERVAAHLVDRNPNCSSG